MPESPRKPDHGPRRLNRRIGWGLVVVVAVSIVLWAPPARATLLVTLLGVGVSGVTVWRGTDNHR
jgi:hypothetical protein